MKCVVYFASALSVLFALSSAAPFPQGGLSGFASLQTSNGAAPSSATPAAGGGGGGLSNILQNIDLPGLLRGVNSFVGLVRVFCPPLSQVLDNVIQNVTSTAFRVFGRAILQNGGLGGGGGAAGAGGQKVNVVLPTFPPDEDYDEDEETNATDSKTSNSDLDVRISGSTTTSTTENSAPAVTNAPATSAPASAVSEDNTISKRHVRVPREAAEAEAEEEEESVDQDVAASAPHPAEDLSNVETDDTDRNKRFLPFGGTGDGHGGGSTGGSGNFLFDIIRLVAGSGATEESDEKENAPGGVAELDLAGKSTGYTEGIPGPITRLFVIANRGIANLVQDLILRLAQTSERLVNFKARLVTALI